MTRTWVALSSCHMKLTKHKLQITKLSPARTLPSVLSHLVFCCLYFAISAASAAAPSVSFSKDLVPILADKCLTCHQDKKAKGRYRIDTFEQVFKPGDSEDLPVTAGKPDASLLYQRLVTHDEDERMPQKDDPLPAEQIALFKQWIEQGAKLDQGDPKALLADLAPKSDISRAPENYPRALPVTALAFTESGESFWSSGYHEVLEWASADGKLLRRLGGMPERVLALGVQRGGDLLAVAGGVPGRTGEAVIVSRASGKIVKRLPGAKDTFLTAAFSPDGKLLALGGADSMVRVFRTGDWKQAWSAEAHADWVLALDFSPDNQLLVSSSRDRTARVFHAAKGDPGVTQTGHAAAVTCASFDAEGKTILSASSDGQIRRWAADAEVDGSGRAKDEILKGSRQEVTRLATFPGFAVTVSSDGRARLYDLSKKEDPTLLKSLDSRLDALAVDPVRKRALFGAASGHVRLLDLDIGDTLLDALVSPGLK
jgi:WD40 repeat protein